MKESQGRGVSLRSITLFNLIFLTAGWCFALNPNRAITQYIHTIINSDNGLPQNIVHSIAQTPDGYLWIGSEEGLARYDGVRFEVFTKDNVPEFKQNEVFALLADRDGSLWIGIYAGGLVHYQNGKFKHYGVQNGLSDERIVSLLQDSAGDLWIGTPNGLNHFKNGKFTVYGTSHGLPERVIWDLLEDENKHIWAATVGKGLYRWNGEKFVKVENISHYDVLALMKDSRGRIWIGTGAGVDLFQDGKVTHYVLKEGKKPEGAISFLEDRDRNIWIGGDSALYRFKNGKFESFSTEQGLSGKGVGEIFEDQEGSLWVGGSGGLNQFRDSKLLTYTIHDGLISNSVSSIHGDQSGVIWIGTAEGLSRFQNDKFTNLAFQKDIPVNSAKTLLLDSKGTLWIGTSGEGLFQYKDGKHSFLNKKSGLISDFVVSIYEDREGAIWIASYGYGVTRIQDGKLSFFTPDNGLSTNYVLNLLQLSDGSVIIGTEAGGINRIHNGKASSWILPDQIKNSQVLSFYEDQNRVLWIGTFGGGLFRYDSGKISQYKKQNGLYDDVVADIVEDKHGNLWAYCGKGIFRLNKKELNDFAKGVVSRIHSTYFGKADGMKSAEMIGGGSFQAADGTIWFPTIKGLVVVDPEKLSINKQPPPVHVEQVIVDHDSFPPMNGGKLEPLKLAPGKEKFEFRYTALSFFAPEKMTFKYRLEGYEADWVDAGIRRVAYYTNLKPGHYTFQVKASNNDGIWNETGAQYSFFLKPRFYQTGWFLLLCVGAVALTGAGAHRIRMRRMSAEFNAVLEERTRIAREIHDSLAQSLAGVVMQLETAKLHGSPEQSKRYSDRALELARQSVDEARRTVGELRQLTETNPDLVKTLQESAKQQAIDAGMNFTFEQKGDTFPLPPQIHSHLLRVCQEAIHNAVKHSHGKSIAVGLNFEVDRVSLSVQDDGIGFDPSHVGSDGHYGLKGMQERAREMKAELSLKTEQGKGTQLRITVPL
jgi:signal transduction histidine kinase/ligand-binding sensor domain-containing protein